MITLPRHPTETPLTTDKTHTVELAGHVAPRHIYHITAQTHTTLIHHTDRIRTTSNITGRIATITVSTSPGTDSTSINTGPILDTSFFEAPGRNSHVFTAQGTNSGNRSPHILVDGQLDNLKLQYFVDSGSNITLVSSNWIKANNLSHLCKPPNISAKSLSNHRLPITGRVHLNCRIAGHEAYQNFYVCENLPYDSLLGTDSLFSKQLLIDFSQKLLISKYGTANFIFAPSPINFSNNVRLQKNTTFEPNKVYFTEAQVIPKDKHHRNTLRYHNFEGIFDPSNQFKMNENLMIARSINHTDNGLIKLQITNISDKPVTIHRSRKLGQLHAVDTQSTHAVNATCKSDKCNAPQSKDNSDIASQLGIYSNNHLTTPQKSVIKNLINKYSSVMSSHRYDVGSVNMPDIDTSIHLIPGSQPKFIPERKIPHHQKPIVQKLIEEMVDNNIAEPCEYSEWNSPLICVAKKGNTPENPQYRACVDLRYLNSCTVKDSYTVPNIDNIYSQLGGAKYFSSFDITSGYHNIPLDESSRPLTAFMFNNQQYMFKTLPQGAKNSGSKFCRVIDKIFGKIPFTQIFAYIDDILICSADFESHVQKLDFVLNTLKSNGLKVNIKKATLCKPSCEFIGYNLSAEGISMSDSRLEAIRKLSPPTDYKSTQSFCGFVNYLRNYCKNLAPIMKPIYALLDKNRKWVWTAECQNSYDHIIESLLSNTLLHHPLFDDNPEHHFIVSVDSCSKGWGGMIEQMQHGKRVLISYWSKTMPKLKRELGSTRQEFIGIYHIIKQFREHLLGKSFEVHTDCKPLLAWETLFSKGSSVQMRQINYLSEFDFNLIHIEGSKHVVPDYFSRQCLNGISVPTQTYDTSLSTALHYDTPHIPDTTVDTSTDTTIGTNTVETTVNTTTDSNISITANTQVTPHEICAVNGSTKFLTSDEIVTAQKQDHVLSIVRKWVSDNKLPDTIQVVDTPPDLLFYFKQFEKLTIINDALHRTWDDKDGQRTLIVIPSSLIETCITQCHSSLESPHFGIDITLDKIRNHFYFYNMKTETKLFVDGCITCARVKQPRAYQKPPLNPINIYQDLNDGLIIDHIGPLPETASGNKYILTCVDFFTGYVVANACKSTTTVETIQIILNNWITKFGFPKNCHHDLGTSFTSKLFQAFLAYFDIESKKGQPYSPTTQGKVESCNKKLKTVFQTVLNPDKCHQWDKYINLVTFALNSTKQYKTGFSANKLVYGRELNQPSHILLNSLNTTSPSSTSPSTHNTAAYQLHRKINNIMLKTRQTVNAMNKYAKTYHDKSVNFSPFLVDDHCLILKHVTKHKYQAKWLGPFKVTKCITPYLYNIALDDGSQKTVNIKIMKRFNPTKYTHMNTVGLDNHAGTHKQQRQQQPPKSSPPPLIHPNSSSDSDSDNDSPQLVKVRKTRTKAATKLPSVAPTRTQPTQTLPTRTMPTHSIIVNEPIDYHVDNTNSDNTLSQTNNASNDELQSPHHEPPQQMDTPNLNPPTDPEPPGSNNPTDMTFREIPPRRSTRIRSAPIHLRDYIVGLLSMTGEFISQSMI